jgi:hypothetical protein
LRAEERTVAACKAYLHELPADARLIEVTEVRPGDLDDIRARIAEVKDEIARVQALPVPSSDLADRIKQYVAELAARARPLVLGVGDGQTLRVQFPLPAVANPIQMSGFSQHDEGNPLWLTAFLHPERLAERLTQAALAGGISASERDARLSALQQEMVELRYAEEASIISSVSNGDDVSRSASPPWAVLMVTTIEQQAAA